MADVAREANVSVTTVSYVIGGRRGNQAAARISDDTRQRVLEAIQAIGYRVNEPARTLRRRRTDRVLLLLDRLSSIYAQHLATSLEAIFGAQGRSLSILLCSTSQHIDNALSMIPRGLADAAIVLPWSQMVDQSLLDVHARHGTPIVVFGNVGHVRPNGFDVVADDETPALVEAVDHLVGRGHRRLGFIAHVAETEFTEPRLAVVRARLADHGIDLPSHMVRTGARDRVAAFDAARQFLTVPSPPTAVFSVSDVGAISTLWAALDRGMRIPDDLAVIGCGNAGECRITFPPLSSAGPVQPDFEAVARLVNERLQPPSRTEDRHLLIPWEFVPRESS